MTLDDVGKIVAALVAVSGVLYGWLQRKDAKRQQEQKDRREAETERRAVDVAAVAAATAERQQWRDDLEAVLAGMSAVNKELRHEFERMRRLVDECEERHAGLAEAHKRTLIELQDVQNRLRAVGA